MKRIFILYILALFVSLASCGTEETDFNPNMGQPVVPGNNNSGGNNGSGNGGNENSGEDNDDNIMSNKLRITVGSSSFNATLEDNATTTAFKSLLPMTVNMSELNGNEKYYYLSGSLPTTVSSPGRIQTGDLMLYGSNCIVLFYESFSTSYSYTRLGRVENPAGLASALGTGGITVTYELQE